MTAEKAAPDERSDSTAEPSRAERKRSRVFVRGMRRHQRILTFVGALIVFLTFIVKDALRENLKDFVDSVDRAESIFILREDVNRLLPRLDSVIDRLDRRSTTGSTGNDVARLVRQLDTLNRIVLIWLDNGEDLLKRMPTWVQRQETVEYESVKAKQVGLVKQLDALRVLSTEHQEPNSYDADALDALLVDINLDTHAFADKVLAYARQVKATNEHRYAVATWASWLLYALGWGLGLAGRLIGVKTLAGGGD